MKILLMVIALALGASAAQPWFGASFDEYADGEALSDRGASGGSWGEFPTADAPAVKVTDGGCAALEVQGASMTNGVAFTATEAAGLEVIAYATDGKTVEARNYLLARHPKGGFAVIVE